MIFFSFIISIAKTLNLPFETANIFRSSHLRSINKFRSNHIFTKNLYINKKLTQKAQKYADFLSNRRYNRNNVIHDPKLTPNQGLVGENIFLDQVSKIELGLGKCRHDECQKLIYSNFRIIRGLCNSWKCNSWNCIYRF